MGISGRERQASHRARQRKALADALAEVEALRARDRFEGLVGYALKQEEWAEVRRRAAAHEQDE